MRRLSVVLIAAAACGGGTPAASTPSPEPASRREITALTIVPRAASACPGEVISVEYKGRLANGSTVTLSRSEIASLARSGTAVEPRDDGSWQTDAQPLLSAFDGFRLSASLTGNPAVKADTVVRPTYECLAARNSIDLRPPRLNEFNSAYVRVGLFRTPFYDSLVVAAVEVPGGGAHVFVIPPRAMRSNVIRIDATGRPGQPGRAGQRGADGGVCENGGAGEDGDDGAAGTSGGQVNIIVETESKWVERLIVISNAGGAGGPGGRAGEGGRAGSSQNGRGGCSPKSGRMGRPGRQGPAGSPGPSPRTTTIPFSLLWAGSPIWNDEQSKLVLEHLIEYTRTAR
ncbi:MAG TPA: hypothetical protein VIP11_26310 [Gemmatimonadaceae bacterium]